jgi:tetratricopeptide (TPR) repeat protein
MGNTKSKATDSSDDAAKAQRFSTSSKDAFTSKQTNVKMAQNDLLIWVDQRIDENNTDCRDYITQFQCAVNTIKTFTDAERCIEFLEDTDNEKVSMIISGALGQQIVPRVHNMSQVDSIFIFCGNKKHHEQWAKDWSKIKGVYTEITPICDVLKKTTQQYEQNAISISIVGTGGDFSKENMDRLDSSFMYTQIMKEILLTIEFEQQHIQEFITYCRDVLRDNKVELKNVDKLEREYQEQTPVWWYTCQCFLYPMLNSGLRLLDTDVIIKLGFFIGDLHRQIEQLHKEQFGSSKSNKSFQVYRGQGIDKKQLEKMTANIGGLLSFNCFLSTSRNRDVSFYFTKEAAKNPDLVGILFVMTINPAQSTTPFASVIDFSVFKKKEDEMLFSMHTVFRIGNITPIDENHRLYQVELTLTDDNDKDFRRLTDYIREETAPDVQGWERLGLVLLKMGHPEKAQQVYEILLEQQTEESAKAPIYNQLGMIKRALGEYEEAIRFYEKDFEISQKRLSPYHPDLATSYNNIGTASRRMGDYSKALSSYEKALAIRQQSLAPDHPDLASSYNNIGIVYDNMGDYPKALSSYEKALAIRQQSLPLYHPDLAGSYNNIGLVYEAMGDYSKALSSHEKSLVIRQQSLPPNHPDLALSHYNIGLLYEKMDNYPKAYSSCERAVEIVQNPLTSNHPNLENYRKKLEDIKKKL